MIYFDNAATTFPKPEVVYRSMDEIYRNFGVNAGRGIYNAANKASELIDITRERVANLLNVGTNKKIVFTPSATIAINLILKGLDWKQGDVIYYSPFEHNAVLRTLYDLKEKFNLKLKKIPVDITTLEFKINELENLFIKDSPNLVVISHVSNVCGVIAPVEEIAKITRKYHGLVMVDAAQAAGLIDINLNDIDYYIWAGHKTMYGPFGIAGFVLDKNTKIPSPLIHGGTGQASELKRMPSQIPTKFEAGSANIHAIAGLNASLKWINEVGADKIYCHDKKLSKETIEILNDFIDTYLFVPKNLEKHINVIGVNISGYTPHEIGKILNERFNIAVRTGLHCAPEAHEFLDTMPNGLVRFSLGYFNNEKDLYKLKKALDSFIV